MKNFRKILTGAAALVLVTGVASADTIGPLTTTTPITTALTDFNDTLAFAQFNPLLGTLESVTFDINGSLTTTLTVTNSDIGGVASQGTATTELQISVEDADNSLGFSNETLPPPPFGNPLLTLLSNPFGYNLAPDTSTTSGPLSKSADSGPLVFTSAAVLGEFTGTGSEDLNAVTLTQTLLSNTGGNTTATQVTDASVSGTVTYTYLAASTGTPEPATFALFSGALLAIGLYRKKAVR